MTKIRGAIDAIVFATLLFLPIAVQIAATTAEKPAWRVLLVKPDGSPHSSWVVHSQYEPKVSYNMFGKSYTGDIIAPIGWLLEVEEVK